MFFYPEILSTLKEYNKRKLISDIMAGIIVGIIAVPLSIALSIASGASPKEGLITACIAGFIVSLLGGSRVQISGPTGAFVVIVYGIISEYGMGGLFGATFLAGIFLVLMGALRMGSLIKYMPKPIISGFTSGIAIVIFGGQIKDLLGLEMEKVPPEFIEKCIAYAHSIKTVSIPSLVMSIGCIGIILITPKFTKLVPGSLVAIVVATGASLMFSLNIPTIGSLYPGLTGAFPKPSLPDISFGGYLSLVSPAFTIALLGAVESLLSAVVADTMIETKHNSDMELIAQGAGNMASALFGGLPVTGAIARTAANVKNGGRTPVSGMVHAAVVFFMMVIFLPYAKMIPMAALAAILTCVCFNMFEWDAFLSIPKMFRSDILVMIISFVLTIVFDLIIAIQFGLILAAFLFIRRMEDETKAHQEKVRGLPRQVIGEDYIKVYTFSGPLFFANTRLFDEIFACTNEETGVIILNMRSVTSIDASAMETLKHFIKKCKSMEVLVYLTQLQTQPYAAVKKANLGTYENLYTKKSLNAAVAAARGVSGLDLG
jgi:SulP family sulfate permease